VHDLALGAPGAFYEALFARIGAGAARAGRGESAARAAELVDAAGSATDAGAAADEIARLRAELAATLGGAPARLRYLVRGDFDLEAAFGRDAFDLVVSQAAFEHFEDVDATFAALARVCRPGALLVAEIDLKTHSRWIRDRDPNNIYRYPDWLYRAFRFRGSPNRLRPRDYAAALARHGWTDIAITPLERLAERHDPRSVAPRFRSPAREMELLSIMLCAKRVAAD
jgi:SAM-dependent methyltransferase